MAGLPPCRNQGFQDRPFGRPFRRPSTPAEAADHILLRDARLQGQGVRRELYRLLDAAACPPLPPPAARATSAGGLRRPIRAALRYTKSTGPIRAISTTPCSLGQPAYRRRHRAAACESALPAAVACPLADTARLDPPPSPSSSLLATRQAALDAVGERVGRQLAERYCRDRPPLTEALEVMKWLCKEFWGEVFRKGVDNLRTNHRCVRTRQGRGGAAGSSLWQAGCAEGFGLGSEGRWSLQPGRSMPRSTCKAKVTLPVLDEHARCITGCDPSAAACAWPNPCWRRGTFVLRDTQFRWLSRLSQNQMPPQIGQALPAPIPKNELAGEQPVGGPLGPCGPCGGVLASRAHGGSRQPGCGAQSHLQPPTWLAEADTQGLPGAAPLPRVPEPSPHQPRPHPSLHTLRLPVQLTTLCCPAPLCGGRCRSWAWSAA